MYDCTDSSETGISGFFLINAPLLKNAGSKTSILSCMNRLNGLNPYLDLSECGPWPPTSVPTQFPFVRKSFIDCEIVFTFQNSFFSFSAVACIIQREYTGN